MAKLSARGRQEIFRVERERDLVPVPPSTTVWRKTTIVLMSDGSTLQKEQVRFAPSEFERSVYGDKPRPHDWGWKKRGKIKAGADPKALLEQLAKQGYVVISAPGISDFDSSYYRALAASAGRNP